MTLRDEIEHRPLLIAALGMAIGIACGLDWRYGWMLLFVLVPLSFARRFIAAATIILGLILSPRGSPPNTQPSFFEGEVVVVSQSVASKDGQRADVRSGSQRFRMYFGDQAIALGDTLRIVGTIRPPNEFSEAYFRNLGLRGWIAPTQIKTIREGPWLWHVARSVRASFGRTIRQYLTPESAAVVDAICFNVDAELAPETYDALSRTGTIHIISTSGLHVMIVATFLAFLLAPLPVPRPVALGLLAILLLIYCGAAGLRPPAVRAASMTMVGYAAYLFRRSPDAPSALAAFMFLELLVSPTSLLDRSFQFSCLIVGGLVLFMRSDSEVLAMHGFWDAVRLSWVASLVSAPLVAFVFGRVAWLSILANLLIAPAITVLTVGALVMWGLGTVAPGMARAAAQFLEGLCGYVLAIVEHLSALGWSVLELPPFSWLWLVVAYAAILWCWRPYVRPA